MENSILFFFFNFDGLPNLVDGGVSLHAPGEAAGSGHSLADVNLEIKVPGLMPGFITKDKLKESANPGT